MIDIFAVDLETKSLVPSQLQYALEPFRYNQGKAIITDISVSGPGDYSKLIKQPSFDEVQDLLIFLRGKRVYMHHAIFDVAWLYAYTLSVDLLIKIDIRDTLLLAKWILNSQSEQFKTKEERDEEGGYDLLSLVTRFLPQDTPGIQDFITMKQQVVPAGVDPGYWEARALADTHYTRLLAIELQNLLPEIQRRGFLISQKQLPYTARSWVEGNPFNSQEVHSLIPKVTAAKTVLANRLGIHESVIQSPSQLSDLLFDNWGLTPLNRGKSKNGLPGKGSTAAGDLKMLALTAQNTSLGEKMKIIMDFKKLQTLQTKYLQGFERVEEYIGKPVCHGTPKIFGTYTGRYTYASKTLRKQEFQTAIAMHQLPRKGPAKKLLIAKEGTKVGKYDASGQEICFMGWASMDDNMLSVLNQGMNVHSWMGTNLTGEQYDDFVKRVKSNDPDAYNTRQAAKLLNLSCQYRIGWKSLQAKFFEDYDKIITQMQSNQYLKVYTTAYPGVPRYWKSTCINARKIGYAETIARRRYYLTDWDTHRWATESSAINFPVQGSGADQKDLIIWLASEKFPEINFLSDVHDESIYGLPEDNAEELHKEIVHFLNAIDYEYFWDREVCVPLTFEGQLGNNFKECKEYAQPWHEIVEMKKKKEVA